MALLTCPECGHKVSEYAAACPECGCPVSLMTNKNIFLNQHTEEKDNDFIIKNGTLEKYMGEDVDVEIPNNVFCIGKEAFYENAMFSVKIPDSVQSIGNYAFWGCNLLSNIFIPASVKSIGDYAFVNCDSLEKIEVAKDNPYYYSENNCLIERKSKTLIAGCNKSKLPSDIKSIGGYAFAFCGELEKIVVPNGTISIGEKAFYCCDYLESVVLPSSVEYIGDGAFEDSSLLESITLPAKFKGEEDRLGIDEDCEITYTEGGSFSKNIS